MVASEDADKSLSRARLMERAQGGDREAKEAWTGWLGEYGQVVAKIGRHRMNPVIPNPRSVTEATVNVHTEQLQRDARVIPTCSTSSTHSTVE